MLVSKHISYDLVWMFLWLPLQALFLYGGVLKNIIGCLNYIIFSAILIMKVDVWYLQGSSTFRLAQQRHKEHIATIYLARRYGQIMAFSGNHPSSRNFCAMDITSGLPDDATMKMATLTMEHGQMVMTYKQMLAQFNMDMGHK